MKDWQGIKKQKLPKTLRTFHKRLGESYDGGFDDGFASGRAAGRQEVADIGKALDRKRVSIHLQALETLIKLGNTHGQLMDTIGRAMQSEKGQL